MRNKYNINSISLESFEKYKLKIESKILAKKSLHEFIKQAWPIIEGKIPFIDSWHIQAICEHLEACYYRNIKNLLINVPPRSSKTSLISIAFPAWVWLHNPEEKFMYASYATSLSNEHALKCRRLIMSDWFQSRWGNIYTIAQDKKAVVTFENNKKGCRISTSVNAVNTGKGANILVCLKYNTFIETSLQKPLYIGDIVERKIDCKILSYNHKNRVLEYKEIEKYEKSPGRKLLRIRFSNGIDLECTEEHLLFVYKKGYVKAKDLKINDLCFEILTDEFVIYDFEKYNNLRNICFVFEIYEENFIPEFVYNLKIKDNHNYFASNILVHNCDDPNSASDGNSEADRRRINLWWDQVWSTRLNNPKNDVRIVVQQRIHEKDISGHLLSNDTNNEWVKLILPMEFEEKRKSRTIVLPTTEGQIWEDPRVKEGQLLCEERFSEKEINKYKQELGSYGYAGQYQQRPSPEAGGIIKKVWFQWWKDTIPPQIEFVLQSYDTALKVNESSAYSACTTWGVFYDHNHIENVILLSMWRGRIEYPELREMVKRLYFDYRDTGKERNYKFKGRPIDMCLIEAKASGDPLIQDLRRAGIACTPFEPNKFGDKIERVRLITPLIEGGRVWLPARPPLYDKLLPWADEFIESVAYFPNAESRDLVDTMTQALIKLKSGLYLANPRDERESVVSKNPVNVY